MQRPIVILLLLLLAAFETQSQSGRIQEKKLLHSSTSKSESNRTAAPEAKSNARFSEALQSQIRTSQPSIVPPSSAELSFADRIDADELEQYLNKTAAKGFRLAQVSQAGVASPTVAAVFNRSNLKYEYEVLITDGSDQKSNRRLNDLAVTGFVYRGMVGPATKILGFGRDRRRVGIIMERQIGQTKQQFEYLLVFAEYDKKPFPLNRNPFPITPFEKDGYHVAGRGDEVFLGERSIENSRADAGLFEYKLTPKADLASVESRLNAVAYSGWRFDRLALQDTETKTIGDYSDSLHPKAYQLTTPSVTCVISRSTSQENSLYKYKTLILNNGGEITSFQKSLDDLAAAGYVIRAEINLDDSLLAILEKKRDHTVSQKIPEYKVINVTGSLNNSQNELNKLLRDGYQFLNLSFARKKYCAVTLVRECAAAVK